MTGVVSIRPMELADVEACERLWHESWTALRRDFHLPVPDVTPERVERMQARIRHLLRTDPAGGYVAEEGGRVVGLAQALVREGLWVLSLFAVSVSVQGRGVGRRLLDAALGHDRERPGLILCSRDPRAMRLYTLAGFRLHPAVFAGGEVDPGRLPAVPVTAVDGHADALRVVDDLDRRARGASRRPDVEHLVAEGAVLLTHDHRRGYVVAGASGPLLLAAEDDATAADLLVAALTRPGGDEVGVAWLTARHQWAIDTALRAGLGLHPSGPVMLRGLPDLGGPYLPSGAFG